MRCGEAKAQRRSSCLTGAAAAREQPCSLSLLQVVLLRIMTGHAATTPTLQPPNLLDRSRPLLEACPDASSPEARAAAAGFVFGSPVAWTVGQVAALFALAAACLDPAPARRPSAAKVAETLRDIIGGATAQPPPAAAAAASATAAPAAQLQLTEEPAPPRSHRSAARHPHAPVTHGSAYEQFLAQTEQQKGEKGRPGSLQAADSPPLDAEVAEAVARLTAGDPSLTRLDLMCSGAVGAHGAAAIGRALVDNAALTHLDLSSSAVGAAGVAAVAEALLTNTTLQALLLTETGCGDGGAESLAAALPANSALQRLELASNGISDTGVAALARALRANSALRKLSLGGNDFGPEGAAQLAAALRAGTSFGGATHTRSALATLDLCGSQLLGAEGVAAIAGALAGNATLTALFLDSVDAGDAGAEALGGALGRDSALRELHLWAAGVGDSGAAALARGLRANGTLVKLVLTDNAIGEEGAEALGAALRENETLEELFLGDNPLGSAGVAAVADGAVGGASEGHRRALRRLQLRRTGAQDAGAEAVARALRGAAAAAAAAAAGSGAALVEIDMSGNNVGAEARARVEEALREINVARGAEGAQELACRF